MALVNGGYSHCMEIKKFFSESDKKKFGYGSLNKSGDRSRTILVLLLPLLILVEVVTKMIVLRFFFFFV